MNRRNFFGTVCGWLAVFWGVKAKAEAPKPASLAMREEFIPKAFGQFKRVLRTCKGAEQFPCGKYMLSLAVYADGYVGDDLRDIRVQLLTPIRGTLASADECLSYSVMPTMLSLEGAAAYWEATVEVQA